MARSGELDLVDEVRILEGANRDLLTCLHQAIAETSQVRRACRIEVAEVRDGYGIEEWLIGELALARPGQRVYLAEWLEQRIAERRAKA